LDHFLRDAGTLTPVIANPLGAQMRIERWQQKAADFV
jgi:hypothetical protein